MRGSALDVGEDILVGLVAVTEEAMCQAYGNERPSVAHQRWQLQAWRADHCCVIKMMRGCNSTLFFRFAHSGVVVLSFHDVGLRRCMRERSSSLFTGASRFDAATSKRCGQHGRINFGAELGERVPKMLRFAET
jgi:hypothetical protein